MFNDGFVGLDLGGSAAQSVVLMAIVIALTVVQFRYIERRVHLLMDVWSAVMVERRPLWTSPPTPSWRSASPLVAFPLYVALVASTHDAATLAAAGCPCGSAATWPRTTAGCGRRGAGGRERPGGPDAPQQFHHVGPGGRLGKIAISILSAYAIVYFRFPLRMVFFWISS